METQKFEIEAAQSNIDWVGKKVTGAHNGTISIKEGTLTLTDGQLAGGEFTIDTTSIKILDVTDPATNAQFAGHLLISLHQNNILKQNLSSPRQKQLTKTATASMVT